MENNYVEYWEENFSIVKPGYITYDGWLDDKISHGKKILELGSGLGSNLSFLLSKGCEVYATDYSTVALKYLKQNYPSAKVSKLDMNEDFEFSNNFFDYVIADLSLHYFNDKRTREIIDEIYRVLKDGGELFARVNSDEDNNFGANSKEKLEHNYYFCETYNKRFFDEEDIIKYFSKIGRVSFVKKKSSRYGKEKIYYEISVKKEREHEI